MIYFSNIRNYDSIKWVYNVNLSVDYMCIYINMFKYYWVKRLLCTYFTKANKFCKMYEVKILHFTVKVIRIHASQASTHWFAFHNICRSTAYAGNYLTTNKNGS